MDDFLEKLNPEQLKPVLDTEGAVLVLAGAGSGKTRVLTSRIAHIIAEGKASLAQILAITFTNKAADEMNSRIYNILGDGDGESKWICTIHSMCVKILRMFGENIGIKSNFSIYTETERASVIKKAYTELEYDEEKILKNAKYHICNAKMLGLDPDQYARKNAYERGIDEVKKIYIKYNDHLKKNNALDFDDLLLETYRLLSEDKQSLEFLSNKFKYILVDEFQDTNAVQYEIIKLLASKHGNLFAVGDDDQSIYGWRGAEIKNILRFGKDFVGAKIYKLERNYRSTKSILNLANVIIKNNVTRHNKTLWTESGDGSRPVYYQAEDEVGEALYAARIIKNHVFNGGKFSDFAILMRINALTRAYEQEFTKYGIPYKVFGGFRFFERKEIKDILAYLRLISNPFDSEAAERVINVPKRGIGAKTVETMYAYANEEGLSLYDACVDAFSLDIPKGAKDKLKEFADLIKDLTISAQESNVSKVVRNVLNFTNLRSAYDDGTDEGDGKLANIDEFIASVDEFVKLNPNAKLDEYLNQVTLSSDLDEMDSSDYAVIATIHAVKGLEFPCVFICGLEEGIIPSSRSENEANEIEEERRLMYVAITRAEKNLYLTRSKSRYLYGRRNPCRPSKFVEELASVLGIKPSTQRYEQTSYGQVKRYTEYNQPADSSQYQNKQTNGQTQRKSQPINLPFMEKPVTNPNAGHYQVGMKVNHARFGKGVIVSIKKGGTVLDIAFDGQGIKELSALIAPLTIISN